jgi:hypothetical protein
MPHVEPITGWLQGAVRSPWSSMGKRCNAADAGYGLNPEGRLAVGTLRRCRSIAGMTLPPSLRLASYPTACRRGVRFLLK